MRIVFDLTSCAKRERKGIANYGVALVRSCRRVAPEHDYVPAVRASRWTKRRLVDDVVPDERVRLLPDVLPTWTLGPADVLHGLGVRLPRSGAIPRVVTVHDINVFEAPELSDPRWRRKRRRRIRQTVARADLVISVSEHGARTLHALLGVPEERIRVVPEGVDLDRFRRPDGDEIRRVTEPLGLADRPYVLLVGTADGRKNHAGLLEAFARADLPDEWMLVLGGPRDAKADALRERARALGLTDDRLRLVGWVPGDDLPALLAGAAFYVCASLHEGFGLPVIEAQACGVPVACSDRAALPETVGDCGVTFDPGDMGAFADALRELAGDPALRADLARRGPARVAERFTWDDVARRTLDVLEEAAALR